MCASGEVHQRRSDVAVEPTIVDRGLKTAQRLRRSVHFQEAFEQKRQFVGAHSILWLRSGEDSELRLGVVASKRTFPRAVDRARVKRLMRESFRLIRHRLSGTDDVVLLARRRLLGVKREAMDRELRYLCRKAGIWGDK